MEKLLFFLLPAVVISSLACASASAQQTDDWGAIEVEAILNNSSGTFSPGMNGRLSAGYIVPSGKAGIYIDWSCGSERISDASHVLMLAGGMPFYTGSKFSVVPKLGLGMASRKGSSDTRDYYLGAALSMTLRYYIIDRFYCGFDTRYVWLNSLSGNAGRYATIPEFGLTIGFLL